MSLDVGKIIQKGRMEKKMSQKDLATVGFLKANVLIHINWGCYYNIFSPILFKKINEKPSVINDYEAGRAIPNNQIMAKIERAIGTEFLNASSHIWLLHDN